jgi:hypothetical protein
MPSFEVNFEVFCGSCGAHLCNKSEGRNSRTRNTPQVTVEPCDVCVKSETDPLKSEIDDLKYQLRLAEERLNEFL